jgi:hypothetical protein
MEKKKKKTPKDINLLAKSIADQTTCDPTCEVMTGDALSNKDTTPAKNPAAVALGRLGGLKGGKARAEKLSAKKRKEIAQKAAKARWGRKR